MTLLDSLLDAILRLDGDALVMHAGEKPYVVLSSASMSTFRGPLSWGQVELSSRPLTGDAVLGMLGQMLSPEQSHTLEEYGAIEQEIDAPGNSGERFVVTAARGGEDVWVEVRRRSKPLQAPSATPSVPHTSPDHAVGPPVARVAAETNPPVAPQLESAPDVQLETAATPAQETFSPLAAGDDQAIGGVDDEVHEIHPIEGDLSAIVDEAGGSAGVFEIASMPGFTIQHEASPVSDDDEHEAAVFEIEADAAFELETRPFEIAQRPAPVPQAEAVPAIDEHAEDVPVIELLRGTEPEVEIVEDVRNAAGSGLLAESAPVAEPETVPEPEPVPEPQRAVEPPPVAEGPPSVLVEPPQPIAAPPSIAAEPSSAAAVTDLVPLAEQTVGEIARESVAAIAEQKVTEAAEQSVGAIAEQKVTEAAEQSVGAIAEQKVTEAAEQSVGAIAQQKVTEAAEQRVGAIAEQKVTEAAEQSVGAIAQQKVTEAAEQRVGAIAEQMVANVAEQQVAGIARMRVSEAAEQQVAAIAGQTVTQVAEQKIGEVAEERIAAIAEQKVAEAAEQHVGAIAEQRVAQAAEQQVAGIAGTRVAEVAEQQISEIAGETVTRIAQQKVGEVAAERVTAAAEERVGAIAERTVANVAEQQVAQIAAARVSEVAEQHVAEIAGPTVARLAHEKIGELAEQRVAALAEQRIAEIAAETVAQIAERQVAALATAKIAELVEQKAAAIAAHEPAPTSERDAEPARDAVVVPHTRPALKLQQPPPPPAAPAASEEASLVELLRAAAAQHASTVYAVVDTRPMMRVEGQISLVGTHPSVAGGEVQRFIFEFAPRDRVTDSEPEWTCMVPGVGRVRCVTFRDHCGAGLIFHLPTGDVSTADELGIPAELQALCSEADGLVVVAGPRSSGKSTLLGAFVDLINRTRYDHVITIESQIRKVHEKRLSFISQREVRGDGDAIAAAARAALREGPDVLVIEDLRAPEALIAALDAARAGRLVFGSISAGTAPAAIERLIDAFPADRRPHVRAALAGSLRAVIAQLLVPKAAGGRVAAREVLLSSPAMRKLVVDGAFEQLPIAIESGRSLGMRTMVDSLGGLVRDGVVEIAGACACAPDRGALISALERDGIDVSGVERRA